MGREEGGVLYSVEREEGGVLVWRERGGGVLERKEVWREGGGVLNVEGGVEREGEVCCRRCLLHHTTHQIWQTAK